MNHEDAKNLAKQILEQDGHRNYEIVSDTHAVGSNVRTIRATEGDVTITMTIDDDTGKLLDKKTSRLNRILLVEPPITVSDRVFAIPTYHSIRKYYSDNTKKARMQSAFLIIGAITGYAISNFDPILGVFIGTIVGALSFCLPPFTKN